MNFKTVLAIAALCWSAAACKSRTAMDYNDMIVKKQKELAQTMDESEPRLKNYFAEYEYDSIAALSSRMEAKIDSITIAIKNQPAPDVKQGQNFKKAALSYFDFMKSVYTSYKNYGLQTTPQGRMFQLQVMSSVTAREDKAIADMQQAQRIFAKDNGFRIRSEKKSDNTLTASPPNQ